MTPTPSLLAEPSRPRAIGMVEGDDGGGGGGIAARSTYEVHVNMDASGAWKHDIAS